MFQLTIENKTFHFSILGFSRLCHPNIPYDKKKMRGDIACNIRQGTFFSKTPVNMELDDEETQENDENDYDGSDEDQFETTDTNNMTINSRSTLHEKNLFDYISDSDE